MLDVLRMFIPIHLTLLLVATHPQLHLLPYPANAVQKCPHSTLARVSKGEEDVGTNLAAEKLGFALRTPKRKEKNKTSSEWPRKNADSSQKSKPEDCDVPQHFGSKIPKLLINQGRSQLHLLARSIPIPERLNLHLSAVPWLQSSWFNII